MLDENGKILWFISLLVNENNRVQNIQKEYLIDVKMKESFWEGD